MHRKTEKYAGKLAWSKGSYGNRPGGYCAQELFYKDQVVKHLE